MPTAEEYNMHVRRVEQSECVSGANEEENQRQSRVKRGESLDTVKRPKKRNQNKRKERETKRTTNDCHLSQKNTDKPWALRFLVLVSCVRLPAKEGKPTPNISTGFSSLGCRAPLCVIHVLLSSLKRNRRQTYGEKREECARKEENKGNKETEEMGDVFLLPLGFFLYGHAVPFDKLQR